MFEKNNIYIIQLGNKSCFNIVRFIIKIKNLTFLFFKDWKFNLLAPSKKNKKTK